MVLTGYHVCNNLLRKRHVKGDEMGKILNPENGVKINLICERIQISMRDIWSVVIRKGILIVISKKWCKFYWCFKLLVVILWITECLILNSMPLCEHIVCYFLLLLILKEHICTNCINCDSLNCSLWCTKLWTMMH